MMQDDLEQFKVLAAAYGAGRQRWPQETLAFYDRVAALPEAQLILAGAQQLDHFLDQWQPQPRGDALCERILDALPAQSAPRRMPVPSWLPAAAMMFVALLGFGNGYLTTDFSDMAARDVPTAFGMMDEEQ